METLTLSERIGWSAFGLYRIGYGARAIVDMVKRERLRGAAAQSTADAALLQLTILERPDLYQRWRGEQWYQESGELLRKIGHAE